MTGTCLIPLISVNNKIQVQTCFISFSFQDQSDKIFFALLNFISLFDNCLEQVCCFYSKQKSRNEKEKEKVNKYYCKN